jgi:hypothetical protein
MDKVLHALIGATLAAAPCDVERAIGLVVVAALAKEIYDSQRGGRADGMDVLATIAGAAPVIYLRWDWK